MDAFNAEINQDKFAEWLKNLDPKGDFKTIKKYESLFKGFNGKSFLEVDFTALSTRVPDFIDYNDIIKEIKKLKDDSLKEEKKDDISVLSQKFIQMKVIDNEKIQFLNELKNKNFKDIKSFFEFFLSNALESLIKNDLNNLKEYFKIPLEHPFKDIIRNDLPFFPDKNKNKCDLRLLDGDLDDPNKKSIVLEKTLSSLTDNDNNSKFCNPLIFLGPSGCGKTKACFDVLKIRYGIFFDFTPGLTEDLNGLLDNTKNIIESEKYKLNAEGTRSLNIQKDLEKEINFEILITLLSRILILFYSKDFLIVHLRIFH